MIQRQYWHGNHESKPPLLSRRRALHHLAGATAAATLFGRRAPLIQAEAAPEATPVQPGGSSSSEEVSFALSGGITTRGQFDYPAYGVPPFPAVLLIQGSGPTDRHETILDPDGVVRQPFIQISNELTRRGMAVFRYDKRGACPPSTICDAAAYAAQTKPVLIADAEMAYSRMVANPRIDANRTAVLGHSEGSWLAPALPYRFPGIRALVLIGTGLGPMHVLSFSQVTLPLLGLAPFDLDGDGAIGPGDVPFTDPIAMVNFQQRIRVQGQLFMLRYEGTAPDLRPVGLNPRLDTNGDGKIDMLTEVRPVYEAFFANIAAPLPIVERYADPAVPPLAQAAFGEGFDTELYASYQALPLDDTLRTLRGLPEPPRLLIVNGANDDQTPASSAQLLADGLASAGFPSTIRIYPGLSHILSPQADIFAPYGAEMQPGPIREIGDWLEEALAREGGDPRS